MVKFVWACKEGIVAIASQKAAAARTNLSVKIVFKMLASRIPQPCAENQAYCGGLWETRRKTFEPQMASRRPNDVVLVPFENVFVKLGTDSQEPVRRFELNSGTSE